MKNWIKVFLVVLSLLMLVTSFSACKDETQNEATGTQGVEEDTLPPSAVEGTGLEIRDYGGKTMNIWYSTVSGWAPTPLSVTEEAVNTGEVLPRAGWDRNDAMESTFGIWVEYTQSKTDANKTNATGDITELRNLASAGDLAKYDIIMTGCTPAGTLAVDGLLYDLLTSDYITPQAYYYESQVNKQMQVLDSMFFAMGYYSMNNTRCLSVDMVNCTILEDAAGKTVDDLYDLVFENKWTVEQLMILGSNYATVTENTGDPYTDRYAWIVSQNNVQTFFYQFGGNLVKYNESLGLYDVVVNSTENQERLSWIQRNISDHIGREIANLSDADFSPAFIGGSSMFYTGTFSSFDKILSSGMDVAVLPTALMKEGDSYRSFSSSWCMNVAMIAKQCRDIDKATYLYEMFMAFSYDYVYPAYYENIFRLRYQTDSKSVQVFDLIASSRFVEFVDVFALYTDWKVAIRKVCNGTGEVASTTKSIEEGLRVSVDNLINGVVK